MEKKIIIDEIKNSLDTSFEEGEAKGRMAEKFEISINLLKKGFDAQTIADITGLTLDEVNNLV